MSIYIKKEIEKESGKQIESYLVNSIKKNNIKLKEIDLNKILYIYKKQISECDWLTYSSIILYIFNTLSNNFKFILSRVIPAFSKVSSSLIAAKSSVLKSLLHKR